LTDVGDTGTATNPVVTLKADVSAKAEIAGVTMYAVDASGGDVEAEVFDEASFWAGALNWYTDSTATTGEVFTRADGTTVAYTAYNIGITGTRAEVKRLQQKFVEGSKFSPLGFLSEGEIANG
jgi:hypothetical protein